MKITVEKEGVVELVKDTTAYILIYLEGTNFKVSGIITPQALAPMLLDVMMRQK